MLVSDRAVCVEPRRNVEHREHNHSFDLCTSDEHSCDDQPRSFLRTLRSKIGSGLFADHDLHRMFTVIDERNHRHEREDLAAIASRRGHEDRQVLNESLDMDLQ
jgi:hypothetical protein